MVQFTDRQFEGKSGPILATSDELAANANNLGDIDAVLSDVYMPDGGGMELVRSLRVEYPNIRDGVGTTFGKWGVTGVPELRS